ncbi:hypothetical protein MMC22_003280 [Lobaria immixta]|nr:hypothetical protein [Lobaria immixta]
MAGGALMETRGGLASLIWSASAFQCTIVFLVLALIVGRYMVTRRVRYAKAPIAGLRQGEGVVAARERFRTEAQQMFIEGYTKYKGTPFYIPTPGGEMLMIPPKYVEELKTAPIDEIDFVATFFEMFEGKYTTMGSRSTLHPRVAKSQLNQHIGEVVGPVAEEIEEAFNDCVPATEDWTEVCMSDQILQIVARASSRMFGGLALSRHTDWLNATINFATDGFIGAQKIKSYPRLLRPLAAPFIPELKRIHRHYEAAEQAVVPLLHTREQQEKKPSDFLQWMTDDAKDEEKNDNFIASIQLKITFAALHTSAAAPTQLLYDLCCMPEYIAPLREEIEAVLAEYGSLNKAALMKLHKLDSVMKESQRFNPLLLSSFDRIVRREYRLRDGFIIPKGTHISVASHAIAMDPELFPNPEVFDGFRFADLRSSSKDLAAAGRLQWASSNLENMAFGYGRHACPGRFFAANEIKQIMVHLLMNYDFKLPDGQTTRPMNEPCETQLIPNHVAKVLIRKRKA